MFAIGPVTPRSYGIIRDVENVPSFTAVALPIAIDEGDTPIEFSGPSRTIEIVSPEAQPYPWTCTALFHVKSNGSTMLPVVIPPETAIPGTAPYARHTHVFRIKSRNMINV
jgi:hypothetical protein